MIPDYYEYCLSFWGGHAVFWCTFIIIVLLLRETCGFRQSVKWHFLFAIYRKFFHTPLTLMVTEGAYKGNLWINILYMISFLGGCVFCYYYMLHYVYNGRLTKIFFFASFGEFVAIILHSSVYILLYCGAKMMNIPIIDPLMAMCAMFGTLGLFWGILHILRPVLEWVRKHEMNNVLTWANIIFGTGYCIVDNSKAVFADSYNSYVIAVSDNTLFQVGYFYTVFFFIFLIAILWFLRKELQLLQMTKNRMMNWYEDIMHNGVKIEDIEMDMESALIEVMSKSSAEGRKESLQNYCSKLQASYERMKGNLYCRDYMVDATLADCVRKCQASGIDTQIYFQTFDRGDLNELTICYIITQCFEAVIEAAKGIQGNEAKIRVNLEAGNVKEMLVFQMQYEQEGRQKIDKRPFRQLERQLENTVLKKNGLIRTKAHKGKVEVMISKSDHQTFGGFPKV